MDVGRTVAALLFCGLGLAGSMAAAADSELLNSVKRNPQLAKATCSRFEDLNAQGKSAYSKKVTREIASEQKLSRQDAEVLVTYVVGMHCPDVR